jgi:ATP synthase protein I
MGAYGMIRAMPHTRSQRNDANGNYARFVGLGITLLLIFGLPTVVGFFLDGLAGTLPLFLLIGLAVGFVGGMYYVYRALQKLGG